MSFRLLFYGEATAVLVYAVIAATLLPRDTVLPARREDMSKAAASTQRASYLAVLADRRYLVFLVAMFVVAMVYVQYLATLPLFLRRHGFSTSVFGALLALNSFVVIVGQLPVTRVVQHWQARSAAVGGTLLISIGMAMYSPLWGLAGLVVATLVWSVAECVGTPTLFYGYPVQAAPERLRGCYVGASQATFALGFAVGPPIGVAVWNRVGDAVWWWAGAAGLLAVVTAWRGIPLQRRPRTHPAAAQAMAAAGGIEA
jgi:predicted MFS family arabinose efflux permease